jgi:hypothetical protein
VTFEVEYIRYLLQEPEPDTKIPFMTVQGLGDFDLSSRQDQAAIAVECMRLYLLKHATAFY